MYRAVDGMGLKIGALTERLRASLWFIPSILVLAAIGLAIATVILDQRFTGFGDTFLLFGGGPDRAADLMSTIASSMLTFTALVFTITMVVLQLASGQFSPRVLRTYLRDRQSQFALGVFVATFVYALLVLQMIRTEAEDRAAFVPVISVSMAFAFVLLSVALFVRYAHHIAQSIRVENVIERVARETRKTLDKVYPVEYDGDSAQAEFETPDREPDAVLTTKEAGIITGVDEDHLHRIACKGDILLHVEHPVGTYLPKGMRLVSVFGNTGELDEEGIRDSIRLGRERTMQQDVGFGFRQLVDIAARALSPSLNDPTTAVQVLDRLHDLLRRLSGRRIPPTVREDEHGSPRLLLPGPNWADFVALACEEIRHYGEGSIQIARRMRVMLADLAEAVPKERAGPVEVQRELLESSVARGLDDWADRRASETGWGRIPY